MRAIHVRFVVDKPETEYIFLRVLRCTPVNTIPPKLRIHLHLSTTITRRKPRRTWEFNQRNALSYIGGACTE